MNARVRLNPTVNALLDRIRPMFPEAADTNDLLIAALTMLIYQCQPQLSGVLATAQTAQTAIPHSTLATAAVSELPQEAIDNVFS